MRSSASDRMLQSTLALYRPRMPYPNGPTNLVRASDKGPVDSCGTCGRLRRKGARFCSHCGLEFDAALAERKVVTVLFADLCDSTSLVAKADPEDAQAYLDLALRTMAEAVDTYGGTVRSVQGDGIIGLFGAPAAQEDHALRACLAALALQRRIRQAPPQPHQPPMRVRIGIHSGEVVVGSINDLLTEHQRMAGAPIHIAARLEKMSPPGGVLVSATTVGLLDAEIDARLFGQCQLRGFDEPVDVYELVLDSQRSAAGPLARRRALAPLVGRDSALAALAAVARRVAIGRMQVLGLRGEAGIGKSRLLEHFSAQAVELGFGLVAMNTRSYTNHLPCSALADLMRALMGAKADLDPQRERVTARALVTQWRPDDQRHAEAAADLLDLGRPGEGWLTLTPRQRNHRIGETLLWLVNERLREGPLLIVIEDVFLADESSLRMLSSLWRKLENRPVLLCLSYRTEFTHEWRDAPWFDEQWLGPLPQVEARQLLGGLLGRHESMEPVIHRLIQIADGNPFFLEQMGLTLIDNSSLVGSPGDYRYVGSGAKFDPPMSIAAVITARVDRLSRGPKNCLEAMAILDETASADLVGAMLGQAAGVTDAQLRLGVSAGLLVRVDNVRIDGDSPQPYAFRHALVRTVLADRLTKPRRKLLHRAAMNALRARLGDRAVERASQLAEHALLGEAWAETAQFSLAAMARLIARSANGAALAMLRQGLQAAQQIDDEATKLPLELALHTEALGALMQRGQFDDMFMHLEKAKELTRKLGDSRRQAAVGLQLAVLLWTRGKYQPGLDAVAQAAAAARSADSRRAEMAAAQARLMLDHGLGRYAAVAEQALDVETHFAAELASRRIMAGWAIVPSVNVKAFRADALARMGELEAAQAICDQGYSELSEHEHAFSRSLLDFVQGCLWTRSGQYGKAIELLRRALVDCRVNDIPTMSPCMVGILGEALGRHGQTAEAIAALENAIADKSYLFAGLYSEYFLRQGLGIALVFAGRCDEALEQLALGRQHAATYQQHGHEAEALLALGEAEMRCGRPHAAELSFKAAQAAARACSMRGVLVQANACLAALGLVMGDAAPLGLARG